MDSNKDTGRDFGSSDCSSSRKRLQSWEKHLRAHEHWVRDRWGGFTYLVIGRNEDFMLDFKDGSLWLHYENDTKASPVGRVLLLEMPTRQGIIDAERMFGCI